MVLQLAVSAQESLAQVQSQAKTILQEECQLALKQVTWEPSSPWRRRQGAQLAKASVKGEMPLVTLRVLLKQTKR